MIVSREPSIPYFGTPVALISSQNPDGGVEPTVPGARAAA
jgi:hypothetical protein